jgi:hypothetical protein
MGGCLPDFAGWSGYPSIAALSINPGIDVMCQVRTQRGEHARSTWPQNFEVRAAEERIIEEDKNACRLAIKDRESAGEVVLARRIQQVYL